VPKPPSQDVSDGGHHHGRRIRFVRDAGKLIRALARKGVKNLTTIQQQTSASMASGMDCCWAKRPDPPPHRNLRRRKQLLEQMVLNGTVQLDLGPSRNVLRAGFAPAAPVSRVFYPHWRRNHGSPRARKSASSMAATYVMETRTKS